MPKLRQHPAAEARARSSTHGPREPPCGAAPPGPDGRKAHERTQRCLRSRGHEGEHRSGLQAWNDGDAAPRSRHKARRETTSAMQWERCGALWGRCKVIPGPLGAQLVWHQCRRKKGHEGDHSCFRDGEFCGAQDRFDARRGT